jgi:hypothetical protein
MESIVRAPPRSPSYLIISTSPNTTTINGIEPTIKVS